MEDSANISLSVAPKKEPYRLWGKWNWLYAMNALYYDNGFRWPPQYHDEIELISIPPGLGGCMIINGQSHAVDTGCLFAIAPGIVHSFDIRFKGRKSFIVMLVMTDNLVSVLKEFPGCPEEDLRERLMHLPLTVPDMSAEFHRLLSGLSRVHELEGNPANDSGIGDALNDIRILCEIFTHLLSAKPQKPGLAVNSPVHAAMDYLEEHCKEELTLDQIASHACMSRYHLSRLFKKHTGMSIWSFLNAVRVRRAQDLLWQGSKNVSQAAYEVGFSDPSYFTKVFVKHSGYTPKDWMNQRAAR